MSWTDSYELPYATVIGRFGSIVSDSLDPDLRPDINPLSGTVTLAPTVPYIKINGTVLQIATITAQVVNGVIVNPDGSEGIRILSTDVENDTITNWGWRATFKIPEVRITPVSFYAVKDEVIDLVNLTTGITGLPVEIAPGPKGDKGDPGEDGHTPEITFDGTTIVVDGVPGPDLKGEPGEGGGGAGVDIQVGGEQPASGWWLDTSGSFMPPNEDTTPPVAGELSVSAGSRSVTLTVTGASDDRPGLMYAFSSDNGANYTDWQPDAEYVFTGLIPGSGYAFRHKVRDQAGNEAVGIAVPTTLPEFQSAFRDAVLALNPWQYWPLDDPVGTPRTSLRNLGSASGMDANGFPVKRDLDAFDGALGAETLGDGNTAALLGSDGFTVLRTSVDLHLHDWTFLFLVKVTEPVGANTSPLWEPVRATLHESGNLIVVTIPATGTKTTPVSIPRAEWGGVHMITVTKSAARTAVYWDDILIGYVDGPSTVDAITSLQAGRTPGVYSSIVYLQGQALGPAEIAALHSTLSEEGTA